MLLWIGQKYATNLDLYIFHFRIGQIIQSLIVSFVIGKLESANSKALFFYKSYLKTHFLFSRSGVY